MGYKSRSGAANQALATLRRFGLTSLAPNGRVVPTKRGITLAVLPDSDDRWREAVRSAALNPSLYRSLYEQFKESGLPSAETMRHDLILSERVHPDAADRVANDFRSTVIFAGLFDASGSPVAKTRPASVSSHDGGRDGVMHVVAKPGRSVPTAGTQEHMFTLDEGPAVLTLPAKLSQESRQDLEEWLALVVRKVKRASAVPAPPESAVEEQGEP